MIRVALAAFLAVALLGAATPAIEDARASTTERELRADLSRVGVVAETLAARHDAVRPAAGPARRTVRIVVPESGWGRASATVTVGAGPEGDRLTWRVGDLTHSVRVAVDLRVWRDGEPTRGEVRLAPGRHRLVLSLVRVDGRPAVVVTVRGLKSDSGRTSPRVRVRSGRGVSV